MRVGWNRRAGHPRQGNDKARTRAADVHIGRFGDIAGFADLGPNRTGEERLSAEPGLSGWRSPQSGSWNVFTVATFANAGDERAHAAAKEVVDKLVDEPVRRR